MGNNLGEITPQTPLSTTDIGPDSLLWHYGGDMRIGFTGLSAGVLQLMHPEVGAGVAQHSNFFDEPWQRIERSLPWILGVIYDENPEATGQTIRDFHTQVRGKDHLQRPYHALHPETFAFTHETFKFMVAQVIDNFSRTPFTPQLQEQLQRESLEWYSRYGVSNRKLPKDVASAKGWWDEMCHEQLEMTPAAKHALEMALSRDVTRVPQIPSLPWKLARWPVSETVRLVTIGGLPDIVRKRFDLPWSAILDQPRLELLQKFVRNAWPRLPQQARYHPRALEGRERTHHAHHAA